MRSTCISKMIKRLFRNLSAKAKTEHWSLSPANLDKFLFYLLLLFLPTQLGLHFWPNFSFIQGIRIDYLSPTLYVTDILICLLFLVCILLKQIKIKLNIYFLFFYVVLFFGLLLSKSPIAGIYGLIKFSEFLFLGFYIYKKIKVNGVFLRVFSLGVLFESLLGILQFINKGSLRGIFYFFGERTFNSQTPNIANANINGELILRPYGTFSHPNVLSAYLLIGLCFIFLFAKPKTRLEKTYYSLTVFLGALGLILALGRVSLFCFAILVLYKFVNFLKLKSIKNLSLLVAFIFVMAIAGLPYLTRFTNLNLNDQSVLQRQSLNSAAASMIHNRWVFGVGINNFLINLPEYLKPQGSFFYLQPVHNIFLLVFSQIGIIGEIMFIVFLILVYKSANKEMRLILLFIFLLGSFDHYFLTLQQGQILFTLILGLCFANQRRSYLIE